MDIDLQDPTTCALPCPDFDNVTPRTPCWAPQNPVSLKKKAQVNFLEARALETPGKYKVTYVFVGDVATAITSWTFR